MPDIERRFTRHNSRPEVQTRDGRPPMIVGYAAVFYDENDPGTEYPLYDDLVERIMPGAFDRAIREDDVRGLFNHDDSLVLGRCKSGTMRLSVDRRGLRYEIDPPDTQTGRDLITLLQRGDVDGSSFAFLPDDTTYRQQGDTYVVERNSVKLFDVGPVAYPAYASTEAGVRGVGNVESVRRELQDWKQKHRNEPLASILARARAVTTLLRESNSA